jgi:transcriptional regulator with XRE-family HTH domain
MKDLIKIEEVQNIEKLENEYDFEKASLLERKLRLMVKERPELKPIRKKIRRLMSDYEQQVWSEIDNVSDELLHESDKAILIIDSERRFLKKRKETIRKKLKDYDITQQDLGVLLGHPKSYISELMNGISQFTMKDLVIIHRLFDISLKILIPTYLQSDTREKLNNIISKLNKPKLKLRKKDLVTE